MSNTPITDSLSTDPAIDKRDVPARVWRTMADLERSLNECEVALNECEAALKTDYYDTLSAKRRSDALATIAGEDQRGAAALADENPTSPQQISAETIDAAAPHHPPKPQRSTADLSSALSPESVGQGDAGAGSNAAQVPASAGVPDLTREEIDEVFFGADAAWARNLTTREEYERRVDLLRRCRGMALRSVKEEG